MPGVLAVLAVLQGLHPLSAQNVGRIGFERYTLANGLEVVLSPDRSTQVVAIDVWYRAGSREEPSGKAGLAKLFERLMFAGSPAVPQGAYGVLVDNVGGQVNAEVDEEAARFGNTMPSSRLALGLWLEADRMRKLAINDTTVGEARLSLLDDLGRRVSEDPYTAAILDGVTGLYDSTSCPGYSHPNIGRAGSITGISTADVQTFFHDHYAPNGARLVIAGDFDPANARALITQYFGDIPRGPDQASTACTANFNSGALTKSVSDRTGGRLAVGRFYRIPAHDHADMPALELLGLILSQGSHSRLMNALARDAKAAIGAQGGILSDRRGPEVFGLFALAAPGVAADSLTSLLNAQVVWAAGDGLTDADLARAKNIYRATAVSVRERPADIAEQLQHAAFFHSSADDINVETDRVMAVTLADLRRVAKTWLAQENSLTLVVIPETAS